MEGIARLGSRAAVTVAIHRAALRAVVSLGRLAPGTGKLRSGRRLASRRVCCAQQISPSVVCTQADDHTRIPSPCYPSRPSIRPCTLRVATYGMPRDISGGGSSFGTAASYICCVGGVIHLSEARRGWRELHDRAAEQRQPLRLAALHRAQ